MTDQDVGESNNSEPTGGSSNDEHSTESEPTRPRLAALRDVETVYGPAEDSRMLASAVVDEVSAGQLILDVGTGSGYVAKCITDETGARVVGTDVNPEACRTAARAGIPVVRADLFGPFRDHVFDAVVCNPPYLPTPPTLEWDDPMEAALSGGPDGRAVIRPFLAGVGRVLAPGGQVFLLISTLTDRDAVDALATDSGFEMQVVADESYPFESLLVCHLRPDSGGE